MTALFRTSSSTLARRNRFAATSVRYWPATPGTPPIRTPACTRNDVSMRWRDCAGMHRATLIAMLAVCSASCANNPPGQEKPPAFSSWQLLPPSTLGAARQVNQRLHAAYGEHEISLDCVVTVNAEHLTVIGLLPGGPRMFT